MYIEKKESQVTELKNKLGAVKGENEYMKKGFLSFKGFQDND